MTDAWDGRPANPERNGWHWLLPSWSSQEHAAFWNSKTHAWGQVITKSAEECANNFTYLGPCLTPAQAAAAVQAEREACAQLMAHMPANRWDGDPCQMIRARGPTDALADAEKAAYQQGWSDREGDFLAGVERTGMAVVDAAALAQAEARGMERAAEIAGAERASAEAWLAHADSYGGPESSERIIYVTKRDIAKRIAAAIRAAAKGDGG